MCLRTAGEAVGLDRAREALALRDARHVDFFAVSEERHVERLPDAVVGYVVEPKLARVLDRRQALELAGARLGQAPCLTRAELDGRVAVALGRAERGHRV